MARLNSQWGSCKICAIQVCAGSIHETKAHVSEHTLPPQLTDSSLESLPIWWKLLICPNKQQWYLCGHSQSVGSGKKVSWSFICLKCFQDWSKLLKLVPMCKKLTQYIVGKMGVLDTFLLTWDTEHQQQTLKEKDRRRYTGEWETWASQAGETGLGEVQGTSREWCCVY